MIAILGIISAGVLFCDDLGFHEFHICLLTKKGYWIWRFVPIPLPLSEVKSIKITLHLHCLIPPKGVAFNDPRLFSLRQDTPLGCFTTCTDATIDTLVGKHNLNSLTTRNCTLLLGNGGEKSRKNVEKIVTEYVCRICRYIYIQYADIYIYNM